MGVRTVNGLSHYTEWTISHVHSGALGWNGFIVFGAIYYLVPRIWGRPGMHSRAAHRVALLARPRRHHALRHRDVGRGRDAGADVARLHRARLPEVLLPRQRHRGEALLRHAPAGRPALPVRRRRHGLERLAHGARAAAAPSPPPLRCRRSSAHGDHRDRPPLRPAARPLRAPRHPLRPCHPDRHLRRRAGRDRAALRHREHGGEGARHAALHAARARRPRRLRARGLLRLPQPADPPLPRRGRALRPLQPRRREHVRPPLPVGLEAHRAGPRARRRAGIPTTGTCGT